MIELSQAAEQGRIVLGGGLVGWALFLIVLGWFLFMRSHNDH